MEAVGGVRGGLSRGSVARPINEHGPLATP